MRRFRFGPVIATLCAAQLVAAPDASANSLSSRNRLDPRPLVGASLVRVLQDDRALDFAVKAKIYPEDPNSMFVTLRGGGISVYDVSVSGDPRLRTRWDSSTDVEGQDRQGDLLVVVARSGALLTFDLSEPDEVRHLATLELEADPGVVRALIGELLRHVGGGPFGALHTKLYRAADDRLYALVTAPASRELIAVDVTDPERPVQAGAVDTEVQFVEGIYVHRGHAFVGGFGSSAVYRVIDVSNPGAMRVVASLHDESHRQMVSEMKPYHPDLLFAALWNDPGGLGVFHAGDPPSLRLLGAVVRPELAWSNRVKVQDNLAFLPLEQDPGGFGVVDVADPRSLKLAAVVRGIRDVSKPYTLAVNRDHLYVFGTREATLAVFHLDRGDPELEFARWSFESGDAVRLVAGLEADDGGGVLRFLDAEASGEASTGARTRGGADGDIGYLEIRPAGGWTASNGLVLEHGLARTFYGRIPAYTIVWDISVPRAGFTLNGCFRHALALCNKIPLHQLDRRNERSAGLFLKLGATPLSQHGFVGNNSLGGYVEGIQADRWHRVALVVDLLREPARASLYVDGVLLREVEDVDFESFASVAEGDPQVAGPVRDGFLLFADGYGAMHAPVRLASLLFVNRAYGAGEVASLGLPGPEGIPAPHERAAGQGPPPRR